MHHVQFGKTGLRVSQLCLGTMTFGYQCDEKTSKEILDTAFDAGIDFIDTADVYPVGAPPKDFGATEEIVGRWMKGRRDQVILATKCFFPTGPKPWDSGNSRQNVMRAIDASLRRLGTDHIDLYQIHAWDHHTPIDETLSAMDDLVRSGKVRYIGCSNVLAYQLARSLGRSEVLNLHKFVSVQPRYNLLFRQNERELLPLCADEGIAVIPYNPLAGGLLTGKHSRGNPTEGTRFTLGFAAERYQDRYWNERMFDVVDVMKDIADETGVSLATLSVQWVLANAAITSPIIGASRAEQLHDAIAATTSPIDLEVKGRLDSLTSEFRHGDAVV
ncbi:MAG: aldo/keto reductase [Ilumatobacteraceae bacterium]